MERLGAQELQRGLVDGQQRAIESHTNETRWLLLEEPQEIGRVSTGGIGLLEGRLAVCRGQGN